MSNKSIKMAASLAIVLAFFVVMLGAYTRLTDAGLGCPDWPGCYGKMILPSQSDALDQAQAVYPTLPIEQRKAWTEMIHRYAAGTLALLILFMGVSALYQRRQKLDFPWHLPIVLMVLVLFQALLGMWTVTLKLLPVVVMGHLLGGMLIFACLSRFRLQLSPFQTQDLASWRPWMRLGVLIVFCQIALGGWVSANYAGLACVGFPSCNGLWWPQMEFSKGFYLFSAVGENYQGGLLDSQARISIQMIHRIWATITALYVLSLSMAMLLKLRLKPLRIGAAIAIVLVIVQFSLGVMNVLFLLPLSVAVAHNGVAALLLATVFSLLHFSKKRSHVNVR